MEEQNKKIHPWEISLGLAPYKFIRLVHAMSGVQHPDVKKGIGNCAHCGHRIVNCYIIETSENVRFGIGSDCVRDIGLEGRELKAFETAEAQFLRQQRFEREEKKTNELFNELTCLIEINKQELQSRPYPFGMRSTRTAYDYAISRNQKIRGSKHLKLLKSILRLKPSPLVDILYK